MYPTIMSRGVLRGGTFKENSEEEATKENLTVKTGRNNEADDIEKKFEMAEEQDIHLQTDSKKKAIMFYPLKVVNKIIVIKSDDE